MTITAAVHMPAYAYRRTTCCDGDGAEISSTQNSSSHARDTGYSRNMNASLTRTLCVAQRMTTRSTTNYLLFSKPVRASAWCVFDAT